MLLMSFASPYYLLGLLAAALPILIHLLTRDRIQRVSFSTLRFFAKGSQAVLRRKRILEAILVAMRAAVCALIALAFARPFLGAGDDGAVTAGAACVIVADVSASMRRPGLTEELQQEAMSAVNSLGDGRDAAALVTFDDRATVAVPLTKDLGKLRAAIARVTPGHGGTEISEAVRRADLVLRRAKAEKKQVLLISDLQRTGWRAPMDWKLAPGVELAVVVPEQGDDGNCAVVQAAYPHGAVASPEPQTIGVRVESFLESERRDVPVTLRINDKDVNTQTVNLRPGTAVPVRFRHALERAGDNPGTVTVSVEDSMPEDNTLYFNVRVIPRIKAILIRGPAVASQRAAAFFLSKALAPGERSPFQVRTVTAAKATAGDVLGARVAILLDVVDVPARVADALRSLLNRGGGVLFLPGDRTQAAAFNQTFADLAPCKLRRKLTPRAGPDETPEAVLTTIDFDHPILAIFHHPHHGDLSRPKFRRFWEVTDSQLAHVLARFDDGRPAMLERRVGAGTSIMLVSPADMRWNDLPLRATFLPLVHQTVRYLAVRTEAETQFVVGDRLPVPKGRRFTDPEGKVRGADSAIASVPGFHSLSGGEGDSPQRTVPGSGDRRGLPTTPSPRPGDREFLFAVNRRAEEADPRAAAPDEIAAALTRAQGEVVEHAAGQATDDGPRGGKLWRYLMLAVIALSVGELALGNHTLRH